MEKTISGIITILTGVIGIYFVLLITGNIQSKERVASLQKRITNLEQHIEKLDNSIFTQRFDINALKFVLDYDNAGSAHAWSNRFDNLEEKVFGKTFQFGVEKPALKQKAESFEWFDAKKGNDANYVADYIKRHGIKGSTALNDCTKKICWNVSPQSCGSYDEIGIGHNCYSGELEFPVNFNPQ